MAVVATPAQPSVPVPDDTHTSERHPWLVRISIALLAAVYVFGSGLSALTGISLTDLDVFFLPSARYVLTGHPWMIYALRYDSSYPTANGPVSIVLLSGVAAVIRQLGWLDNLDLRRMVVMAAFSIFPLLMSWEAVAAVDRLRGAPLRGIWRLLAFALFATAPALWHAELLYGHIEQPIAIWLTLMSIRLHAEGRPGWAGVSMGLALLTRTSILLPCLVLVVILLGRRSMVPALTFVAITGLTAIIGILPFALADAHDVLYSLVTFRGGLVIGGGSLWYLMIGTPLEIVGQRYDSSTVLAAALLIALIFLVVRRELTIAHRDFYGLLAITGLAFPLLIKTAWPYYFLDLYVFIAIWWLGDARGWRTPVRWVGILLPAFFVVCEVIADYGVGVQLDVPAIHAESLAITVLEVGFLIAFGVYLVVRATHFSEPSQSQLAVTAPAP